MIRGTTPSFIFNVEVPEDEISKIEVTFKQENTGAEVKKVYETNSPDFENGELNVSLSREDSELFSVGICKVQLRIQTKDNRILASDINKIKVEPALSTTVIGG